jgi:hypothetical protein
VLRFAFTLVAATCAVGSIAAITGCGNGDTASSTTTSSSSSSGSGGAGGGVEAPPWVVGPSIIVSGEDNDNNSNCRNKICRHNENTDLTIYQGQTWLVHRTAYSQILGPNSSIRVYKSSDHGETFENTAILPAIDGRDIRDPHFYQVGGKLFIKVVTRLPVMSTRDSNVEMISMAASSSDGKTWSKFTELAPKTWSFWRIKEFKGKYYVTAYHDGDTSVVMYSSDDGLTWTQGAVVYDKAKDTILEGELTFMDSGKLLVLIREDGTDDELLGDAGRLRTKICWADPPYSTFDCPQEFHGARLDGSCTFFHDGRLFDIARRNILNPNDKKRTALYEILGDFQHGGTLTLKDWGDLPSAGDTSYAGVAPVDSHTILASWYSGNLIKDEGWAFGMEDITDIWRAKIDFNLLK